MDTAVYANGARATPEAHYAHIQEIRNQQAIMRSQAKRDGTKLNRKTLPQTSFVYCAEKICKKRVHLTNTPSAEGQTYVHQDPNVPALDLWFSHYGKNTKHAAHPQCPQYLKDNKRYANLPQNHFVKETRAKVKAKLAEPDNVKTFHAELEKMFGKRPPGVIDALIKKATNKYAHRAVLIDHPELFTTFVALHAGLHTQVLKSGGIKHHVIFKRFGSQKVNYVGLDQNVHTYSVPKFIQLYFKDGLGGSRPNAVEGWRHNVAVKWNRPSKPTASNDHSPQSGSAPAPTTPPSILPPIPRSPTAQKKADKRDHLRAQADANPMMDFSAAAQLVTPSAAPIIAATLELVPLALTPPEAKTHSRKVGTPVRKKDKQPTKPRPSNSRSARAARVSESLAF